MSGSTASTAERFRQLLNRPGAIELPGCYDVLSSLIIERAGFSTVFLSGYGFAASYMGNPDIGLTTLTETSALTRNITSAVRIPLVVDADNGYGNEDNVLRTVRELEGAGAAALILEDQVSPKRCGHTSNKAVIPLDQYMKKLECALNARQTPMCVIARTDALTLDEAIRRARTFHSAGADVTLIDGLRSLDDMKRVGQEVPGHKQINLIYGGKTPLLPLADLHALGFKVVLYSTPALYAASAALFRSMKRLEETHDLNSISLSSTTFADFQRFIEGCYVERNEALTGQSADTLPNERTA